MLMGMSEVNRPLNESRLDCHDENQAFWVTAKELAGLVGMPTTDRRTRDVLDELASKKEGSKRRRSGTKAFEYHISILPKPVRERFISNSDAMLDRYEKLGIDMAATLEEDESVISEVLDNDASSELLDVVNINVSLHDSDSLSRDINSTVPVSGAWLKRRNLKSSDLAFYVQTGYSMADRINPNDIVIINKSDNRLVDGQMVAVLLDDIVLVRYLQKSVGGWTLRCANPTYQPVKLIFGPQYDYKILGRVVRIISDVW